MMERVLTANLVTLRKNCSEIKRNLYDVDFIVIRFKGTVSCFQLAPVMI